MYNFKCFYILMYKFNYNSCILLSANADIVAYKGMWGTLHSLHISDYIKDDPTIFVPIQCILEPGAPWMEKFLSVMILTWLWHNLYCIKWYLKKGKRRQSMKSFSLVWTGPTHPLTKVTTPQDTMGWWRIWYTATRCLHLQEKMKRTHIAGKRKTWTT